MERVEIEMVSSPDNHDGIKKAVAAGFFYHTARLQKDGSYKTVKAPQTVHLHPSSSLSQVRWGAVRCGGPWQWRRRWWCRRPFVGAAVWVADKKGAVTHPKLARTV